MEDDLDIFDEPLAQKKGAGAGAWFLIIIMALTVALIGGVWNKSWNHGEISKTGLAGLRSIQEFKVGETGFVSAKDVRVFFRADQKNLVGFLTSIAQVRGKQEPGVSIKVIRAETGFHLNLLGTKVPVQNYKDCGDCGALHKSGKYVAISKVE